MLLDDVDGLVEGEPRRANEGFALFLGEGLVQAAIDGLFECVELLEDEEGGHDPVGEEEEQHALLVAVGHTHGLHALVEGVQVGLGLLRGERGSLHSVILITEDMMGNGCWDIKREVIQSYHKEEV